MDGKEIDERRETCAMKFFVFYFLFFIFYFLFLFFIFLSLGFYSPGVGGLILYSPKLRYHNGHSIFM